MVLYVLVFLYADSTNDWRLPSRTCSERAIAGSMSAVTFRRGPSLCSKRNEWLTVSYHSSKQFLAILPQNSLPRSFVGTKHDVLSSQLLIWLLRCKDEMGTHTSANHDDVEVSSGLGRRHTVHWTGSHSSSRNGTRREAGRYGQGVGCIYGRARKGREKVGGISGSQRQRRVDCASKRCGGEAGTDSSMPGRCSGDEGRNPGRYGGAEVGVHVDDGVEVILRDEMRSRRCKRFTQAGKG